MRQTQVRDAERTRRMVLDAAVEVLVRKGAGLTVAEVATEAGVSKSGLLHHFPSRDALLVEVLRDTQERLREEVAGRVEASDDRPGKLLRAYVRTFCGPWSALAETLNAVPFWAGLDGVEGAAQLEREDVEWWRREFLADGLAPTTIRVIRRAAEGLAMARMFGEETPEEVADAGELLIGLTLSGMPTPEAAH